MGRVGWVHVQPHAGGAGFGCAIEYHEDREAQIKGLHS